MRIHRVALAAMISLGVFVGTPSYAGSNGVSIAKRYLGGNPTGMSRLWCARFLNMMEKKAGRRGTGSNMALSFAKYGKGVRSPRPGDIAVSRRRGGGHVGYVVSVRGSRVTIISGNTGSRRGGKRRVGIGTYPKSRFFTYRRI